MGNGVWLVGSRGMLGTEVGEALGARNIPFAATDLETDITDFEVVNRFVRSEDFAWIVNCAAYTAVDDAEDNRDLAFSINATGPKNLATAAKNSGATLVHISTDYVFSGESAVPYDSESVAGPRCVYGQSKLAGEEFVRAGTGRHFLIRTAWLYGKNGKNFVSTMLGLMNSRDSLQVVNDQQGTPTYAVDLAAVIADLVARSMSNYGIYHYTNAGQTTWYDFALEIYKTGRQFGLIGNECETEPVPSTAYLTKAKRPRYSVLDCSGIEVLMEMERPSWEDGLRRFLLDYAARKTG